MKQLEHARKRLAYARAQRERFECTMDHTEAEHRTLRKLEQAERLAEQDIAWLTNALTQGD